MSPLRWTCKSTTQLAIELRGRGHRVSQATAWRQLDELSYSMQSNRKTRERADHPDRNAHFEFIDLATLGPPNKGSPFVTNGQEAVRGLWSGVRGEPPRPLLNKDVRGKRVSARGVGAGSARSAPRIPTIATAKSRRKRTPCIGASTVADALHTWACERWRNGLGQRPHVRAESRVYQHQGTGRGPEKNSTPAGEVSRNIGQP
jgi:hypothetical protein